MARVGKCTICGRDNISLPVKGLCGKCYLKARKEKAEKGARQALDNIPPGYVTTQTPAMKTPTPANGNGNGLFPPLTLKFEERDSALIDALEEEATKQRRTPDQHILWILEQRYANLLHP